MRSAGARDHLISIALALLLALLTQRGKFLLNIDPLFPIAPEKQLSIYIDLIRTHDSIGYAHTDYHFIPLLAFEATLVKMLAPLGIGVAHIATQLIVLVLIYYVMSISSYLLFRSGIYRMPRTTAWILAITYIFNPVSITMTFYRFTGWTILYCLSPAVALLLARYYRSRSINPGKYGLALIALLNSPIATLLYSLGLVINIAFLVILVALFTINKISWSSIIKISVASIIIAISGTLYVFPQILMLSIISEAYEGGYSNIDQLLYASQYTSLLNIFRFLAHYVLWSADLYNYYFPYAWMSNELFSKIYQLASLLYAAIYSITILILSMDFRRSRRSIPIAILLLTIPLILKGAHDPFPQLGLALFGLNEIFFRHPYERLIFSFYWIWLFSLGILIEKGSAKTVRLLTSVLVALAALNFAPFILDVSHEFQRIPSSLVDTLYKIKLDIPECRGGRILVMPFDAISRETSYNISGIVVHPNENALEYAFLERFLKFPRTYVDGKILRELYSYMWNNDPYGFLLHARIYGFSCIFLEKFSSDILFVHHENRFVVRYSGEFVRIMEEKGLIKSAQDTELYTLYIIDWPPINNSYLLRPSFISNNASYTWQAIYIPSGGLYRIITASRFNGYAEITNDTHRILVPLNTIKDVDLSPAPYVIHIYIPDTTIYKAKFCNGKWEPVSNLYSVRKCVFGDSLEIYTETSDPTANDTIYGDSIYVSPNEYYILRVSIVGYNVISPHIEVEGMDYTGGRWIPIDRCPQRDEVMGSYLAQNFTCILKSPSWTNKMRILIKAGRSQGLYPAIVQFRSLEVERVRGEAYLLLFMSKHLQVWINSEKPLEITIFSTTRTNATFNIAYSELFRAKIDGTRAKVFNFNGYLAVEVPEGVHRVELDINWEVGYLLWIHIALVSIASLAITHSLFRGMQKYRDIDIGSGNKNSG